MNITAGRQADPLGAEGPLLGLKSAANVDCLVRCRKTVVTAPAKFVLQYCVARYDIIRGINDPTSSIQLAEIHFETYILSMFSISHPPTWTSRIEHIITYSFIFEAIFLQALDPRSRKVGVYHYKGETPRGHPSAHSR